MSPGCLDRVSQPPSQFIGSTLIGYEQEQIRWPDLRKWLCSIHEASSINQNVTGLWSESWVYRLALDG